MADFNDMIHISMGMINDQFEEYILICSLLFAVVYFGLYFVIRKSYWNKFNKNIELELAETEAIAYVYQPEIMIQRIIAIIASDTCIFGACIVDYLLVMNNSFLAEYQDFLLLALIAVSIVVNNILVKVLKLNIFDCEKIDRVGETTKNNKIAANIKLVSSFAVFILMIFFSFVFQTKDYIPLIRCMLGLTLGRFLYFDTSIQGLTEEIAQFYPYLKYMAGAILLTIAYVIIGILVNAIEMDDLFLSIFVAHIIILMVSKVTKEILDDLNL